MSMVEIYLDLEMDVVPSVEHVGLTTCRRTRRHGGLVVIVADVGSN